MYKFGLNKLHLPLERSVNRQLLNCFDDLALHAWPESPKGIGTPGSNRGLSSRYRRGYSYSQSCIPQTCQSGKGWHTSGERTTTPFDKTIERYRTEKKFGPGRPSSVASYQTGPREEMQNARCSQLQKIVQVKRNLLISSCFKTWTSICRSHRNHCIPDSSGVFGTPTRPSRVPSLNMGKNDTVAFPKKNPAKSPGEKTVKKTVQPFQTINSLNQGSEKLVSRETQTCNLNEETRLSSIIEKLSRTMLSTKTKRRCLYLWRERSRNCYANRKGIEALSRVLHIRLVWAMRMLNIHYERVNLKELSLGMLENIQIWINNAIEVKNTKRYQQGLGPVAEDSSAAPTGNPTLLTAYHCFTSPVVHREYDLQQLKSSKTRAQEKKLAPQKELRRSLADSDIVPTEEEKSWQHIPSSAPGITKPPPLPRVLDIQQLIPVMEGWGFDDLLKGSSLTVFAASRMEFHCSVVGTNLVWSKTKRSKEPKDLVYNWLCDVYSSGECPSLSATKIRKSKSRRFFGGRNEEEIILNLLDIKKLLYTWRSSTESAMSRKDVRWRRFIIVLNNCTKATSVLSRDGGNTIEVCCDSDALLYSWVIGLNAMTRFLVNFPHPHSFLNNNCTTFISKKPKNEESTEGWESMKHKTDKDKNALVFRKVRRRWQWGKLK